MWLRRLFAALALVPIALPAQATVPGAVDITCDVDRTAFRSAAKTATAVTFRLWPTPAGGTQIGSDYVVSMADLVAFKRYSDKVDSQAKRKALRLSAVIGSDATPVLLPADGVAWLDVSVGLQTFTCDFSSQAPQARRRFQAAPFAREASQISDISARVSKASATSIPDGTPAGPASYTALPFDSERWDTAGIHSNTTNNSRLTVPADGKYYIYGNVEWDINATGVRALMIREGGVSNRALVIGPAVSGVGTSQFISTHLELQTGQYVELVAAQNSGGPLDIVYQPISSQEFGMVKLP